MRYHIECRVKDLAEPQEWVGVTGRDGDTFTDQDVQQFLGDITLEDFECGYEYRVRLHDDYVQNEATRIVYVKPPMERREPRPDSFVHQLMARAFLQAA